MTDPSYKPHTFKSGHRPRQPEHYRLRRGQLPGLGPERRHRHGRLRPEHQPGQHPQQARHLRHQPGELPAHQQACRHGALRQSALPYQNTAWGSEELAELPVYFKPALRVQYQGIDQTYSSDALYGRRLTLTYNAANQPVLKLDGVAVGSPGTAVTPGVATTVTFTVAHHPSVARSSRRMVGFTALLRVGRSRL